MASGESAFDRSLAGATVKTTEISNGVVLANVEVFEGGESDTGAPIFGALGVVARPLDPDDDGAAEAVCARASNGLPVMAMRDVRVEQQAAVEQEKGVLRVAWYRGAMLSMAPAESGTGSIVTLYVPFDHDGDGEPQKAHVFSMDPGEEAVVLAAASGAALVLASDGSATCKSGNGENFLSVTDDGVTFSGDLRMPNSNLVVGDPALVKDVALAQPAIDVLAKIVPMLATLAAAVNTLAPGTIPPSEITQLVTAGAPYVAGGATCRAPRITGQPGP